MTRNWAAWPVGLICLATFGVTGYEWFEARTAFRAGQSPVVAVQATQQQILHVLANPWVFSVYVILLLSLLFPVVRKISRKTSTTNDYWVLAALLAAVVALVRIFVRFH